MSYIEHRIPLADGLKLYLREYPAHGAAQRAPVICLPGLTRNSADFEVVAPRIAALGRRVVVPDLRGRGHSDYDPDPSRYRPDVYLQDALYALDMLDIPAAVFVGTSLGGLITMLAGAMAPDRVVAAVINDIGPVIDPAGLARIASYVGRSGPFAAWPELIETIKRTQSAAFPDAVEADWRTFAHRVARERPDGKVAFAYDPAIAQSFAQPQDAPPPSFLPMFQALAKKPVLLVRGALSDILAADGVAVMRQEKPDLDVVELPRIGHAPTLEEPAAWHAIAGFLARVP
jgi:pimeloyl-ACP methyl ester carboxylesterase